jgi:exodeoxyribonuclease VII large subunit
MENDQFPIFSVSDFLASVNQTLEYAYPAIEIEGEVSSFKVNQNKFVFFDLKDESASIGCFMTVWQLRVPIEDGMKVVIRAVPKLTQWGKFSLTVQAIRPKGEGSLKKSFELLLAKLEKEGLFSEDRKRTLPSIPQQIAVISSTQAAGYADFIKILNDRWGGVNVSVAHVQVQGEAAPDQMIRAIQYFNGLEQLPEVLVIIRGGGSADDLAAFNDEQLVRAIAASRIPTLVGVGHEVDVSLADMVADVRAATPSNAAQIIVPDRRELIAAVHHTMNTLSRSATGAIKELEQIISVRLERAVEVALTVIRHHEQQLAASTSILEAYNPSAVLKRGYAIVRGEVAIGSAIIIERQNDTIEAEVTNVKHN